MNDLVDYQRTHHRKKYVQDYSKGILDIIEMDYPRQYFLMIEGQAGTATLFSEEEWIDILTKSRSSYDCQIRRMNLTRNTIQA